MARRRSSLHYYLLERAAFKKLSTDDEREQFIEQFWERRNPNPGNPENEFKEEYYRRIAYANEHYASGIPGWRTDRGESTSCMARRTRSMTTPAAVLPTTGMRVVAQTSTYPFETWRYRYIDGIGTNIDS